MTEENKKVWDKLSAFSLDNPEARFSFSDRLYRENSWSKDYANRVIDEYKKFVFLSKITGKSLTPSDEVDQAWHLHLIYSHSYWVEMCGELLDGLKLHHGPTKGGKAESEKYDRQYQYTLEVYKETFGTDAPADIWPDASIRFAPANFKRVNVLQNIVLSVAKVKEYMFTYALPTLAVAIMMFFMSATTENDTDGWVILYWIIGLAVAIFLIRGLYRYANRDERRSDSTHIDRYIERNKQFTSKPTTTSRTTKSSKSDKKSDNTNNGCSAAGSFFGCSSGCSSSSDSGCGSSGCGSSCGSSCGGGCGGCGG